MRSWNQAVSSAITGTMRMTAAARPGSSANMMANTPSTYNTAHRTSTMFQAMMAAMRLVSLMMRESR